MNGTLALGQSFKSQKYILIYCCFCVLFNAMLDISTTQSISYTAGPIENCALCPSRYIEMILYADEGSVLDPPPAPLVRTHHFIF